MQYQISFNGVMTAELEQILRVVERRLGMVGVHADLGGDSASGASSVASAPCVGAGCVMPAVPPHNPPIDYLLTLGGGVILGAAVAVGAIKATGKSSPS